MKNYLKYDDTQVFKYDNFVLAVIYTIGHILIAITCNRIITGATFDAAAADAFIEPIINGFWFYLLLVVLKKIILDKVNSSKLSFLNANQIGVYLAILYTIGQRQGLGIGGIKDKHELPWYVYGKNINKNEIYV